MPARLRWSSRASAIGRSGRAERRRTASVASQSGPSRSGPRCPTRRCSCPVGTSDTSCRWKPTATACAVCSTTRIMWAGRPRHASPGGYVRQAPSMRRCECKVHSPPPDRSGARSRSSRCLPRLVDAATRQPARSVVASDGTRKSVRTMSAPPIAASSCAAVFHTVSPSGMVPSCPLGRLVNRRASRPPRFRPGRAMRAWMSPSGQVAAALGVHIGEFLNVGDRIIIAVVQVRIRVAAVADVPAVVRLSAALFAEDAGAYDKYTDQSWPQREGAAYFAAVVGGEHTRGWLAELDGRPVASLVGRVLRENSLRPVRVADLESIYVLPRSEEH